MNYIAMMNKIESILKAAQDRPKRKKAGAKGLLAPRANSIASKRADSGSKGEPPTELLLARYVAQIRKAKAEMKKAMEKENKDAR